MRRHSRKTSSVPEVGSFPQLGKAEENILLPGFGRFSADSIQFQASSSVEVEKLGGFQLNTPTIIFLGIQCSTLELEGFRCSGKLKADYPQRTSDSEL